MGCRKPIFVASMRAASPCYIGVGVGLEGPDVDADG
jgi:hypothetical protein